MLLKGSWIVAPLGILLGVQYCKKVKFSILKIHLKLMNNKNVGLSVVFLSKIQINTFYLLLAIFYILYIFTNI